MLKTNIVMCIKTNERTTVRKNATFHSRDFGVAGAGGNLFGPTEEHAAKH